MANELSGVCCLVLGGGGFIGHGLVRALQEQGAKVTGFGRTGMFGRPKTELPWIDGDSRDLKSLASAVHGNEIVFHLLGGSTPEASNSEPLADLTRSVLNTAELLEICREKCVRKIIFASSGGTVYGIPKLIPIYEEHTTDPISAYGVNKLAAEKYLALYDFLHGIQHVSLRISNPFGPFQSPWRRQGLIAATILKLLSDAPIEIWGDGSVVRDYLFINDVVDAFIKAAKYEGKPNVFNIGSGVGLTVKEVIDDIASVLGFENPKTVYKPSRRADVPSNVLDISRARGGLQWVPFTPWRDAIKSTAIWMQEDAAVKDFIRRGDL